MGFLRRACPALLPHSPMMPKTPIEAKKSGRSAPWLMAKTATKFGQL